MSTTTRLMRDLDQRMIGGVCAGIARRYEWDPTLVRVAVVLAAVISGGIVLVAYLAAWVVMPAGTDTEAGVTPALKDEFRDAGERAAESARIIARAAKQAATEIADVARRPAPAGTAATAAAPAPTAEAASAPEAPAAPAADTPAAEATPSDAATTDEAPRTPPAAG
ncbi:MAG: hypothetical protein AMXMBFR23_27540 [Chloroflexota bacterium]